MRGRTHHNVKHNTKQTVSSLLTSDHEMRDLSNQSFVFNELHHEVVLCVTFTPNGEEVEGLTEAQCERVTTNFFTSLSD